MKNMGLCVSSIFRTQGYTVSQCTPLFKMIPQAYQYLNSKKMCFSAVPRPHGHHVRRQVLFFHRNPERGGRERCQGRFRHPHHNQVRQLQRPSLLQFTFVRKIIFYQLNNPWCRSIVSAVSTAFR